MCKRNQPGENKPSTCLQHHSCENRWKVSIREQKPLWKSPCKAVRLRTKVEVPAQTVFKPPFFPPRRKEPFLPALTGLTNNNTCF